MSHSENKPKSNQTTSTESTNLNVQGTEGVVVAGSEGNVITLTDQGAISVAEAIAEKSLETADLGVSRAFDFGVDVVRTAQTTVGDSLDFAKDSLERTLDEVSDSRAGAFDFAGELFRESIDRVSDVVENSQNQLGGTVTALNAIARENATSSDQRVQSIAEKGLIVAGVIAGSVLLAGVAYAVAK